jgi:hypothetical protein
VSEPNRGGGLTRRYPTKQRGEKERMMNEKESRREEGEQTKEEMRFY